MVQDLLFRVQGSGFRVQGLLFRVHGLGLIPKGLRFYCVRDTISGFKV
jgi:hypothetical protein